MDKESQVRKLVDSVSPRTAHQYKSYGDKYIRWLRDTGILQNEDEGEVLYRDLPLSAQLVHWFLIDTLVRNGGNETEDDFKIPTLKKVISGLKFLHKLCLIHGNKLVFDEKYLENVIKLHSNWATVRSQKQTTLPIVKVSLNLWNSHTESLSEKFFKTSLEKLRFLVDFHFRVYTNLSYEQRSKIKLSELHGEVGVLAMDQKVWSSLQVYMPNSTRQVKSHMPLSIRSQELPFLCPLTSLASYLYLRFYGISSVTKGDGFPDLLASDQDDLYWKDLPLIRGKSLTDYPREETMSNYYSAVFRYCHLPYKRREYFNKSTLEYPTWSHQSFTDFFDKYPSAKRTAFQHEVPFDYDRIMNLRSLNETKENELLSALPESLLVQIFPEVEQYKRKVDQLSPEAKAFIQTMENLRKRFLYNLPWIHEIFPQHDLFKDPIFQNSDFQSYFHQVVGNKWENDQLPFNVLPGFSKLDKKEFSGLLMESLVPEEQRVSNDVAKAPTPSIGSDELMDKTYQFVQYQTLTNFQILLSLLSKIFDKLEMKKSSREFMIHQLDLLHDTIRKNINVSKPQDVDEYIKKEEKLEGEEKVQAKESQSRHRSNGLLAIDDSPSEEDSDEGGAEVQEELKFMINEFVGERVRTTVKQQIEHWESRIQDIVKESVKEEVSKRFADYEESAQKRPRLSSTPPVANNESNPTIPASVNIVGEVGCFEMSPDLDTVEAVILEWFTPNPDMNNECVHSMNRLHGKEWRSKFEKLYKERKIIVEFYIHLVNQLGVNRYKAVEICEILRRSSEADGSLASLAKLLKEWKRKNGNSYNGLLEYHKLSAK